MKNEKAKELIEKYAIGNSRDAAPSMLKKTCILCVELAEQEAEERMHNELTRWKDPVEQPEDGCICLLKFRSNGFFVHYEGGIFSKKDGEWHDSENMFTYNRDVILAWRPLYDMPG